LIKDEIDQLHRNGTSIIFSTHRMEQVEEICQYIVLINRGQNVLEGPVDEIKNKFKENLFQIEFEGTLPGDINERASIIEQQSNKIIAKVESDEHSNRLLMYLIQNGVLIHGFKEILPSLNEIFIRQVGMTREELAAVNAAAK